MTELLYSCLTVRMELNKPSTTGFLPPYFQTLATSSLSVMIRNSYISTELLQNGNFLVQGGFVLITSQSRLSPKLSNTTWDYLFNVPREMLVSPYQSRYASSYICSCFSVPLLMSYFRILIFSDSLSASMQAADKNRRAKYGQKSSYSRPSIHLTQK